jgi:putrescine aminotransferase
VETPGVAVTSVIDKYAKHVNPSFIRLLGVLGYGRVFERALDVRVWDDQGREYLDFLAGFGSVNVGHHHPRLAARLRDFLERQPMNLVHVGPCAAAADLAEALAELAAPLEVALFSSGGGEAVESALKLARAATGRSGFVYGEGGFHGTGFGALSVMGEERLRKPFEPLLEDCHAVPFGDLPALEKALGRRRPAAFLVEPLQGEGGVRVAPPGYLKGARDLCRAAGTLLILDEVQTGLGRTGTMFAFQTEEIVPDVLVLGKALGGSLVPLSVALTTREIHQRAYGSMDKFDLHSSTFAGNALGCTTALETLRILRDESLVANSAERGRQLLDGLKRRLSGHPLVREIRGRGLLVGIELGPTDSGWIGAFTRPIVRKVSKSVFGQWASLKLLERGILCQPASQQWNVLRLEPPLTVKAADVDRVVAAVGEVLDEYRGIAPLLKDVAGRLKRQHARGWAFP